MARRRSSEPRQRGKKEPARIGNAFESDDMMTFVLGQWVAVTSSNVAEAMYHEQSRTLYIGFDGGEPERGIDYYAYFDVPFSMATSFANTASKGTWVWERLRRTNWPFAPVEKNRVPKSVQRAAAREMNRRTEAQQDD